LFRRKLIAKILSAKTSAALLSIILYIAIASRSCYALGSAQANNIINPLSGRLVVLDPGHGGEGWGAAYHGLLEKDVNLDVALRTKALLEEANVEVAMTRANDTNLPLMARTDLANNLKADIFASIHSNAATDQSENGTETFYPDGAGQRENASKNLATFVQEELVKLLGRRDRGVKADFPWLEKHLYVLTYTNMAAILTELAFVSNPEEVTLLKNSTFRQNAAQAIFNGIEKYLESLPTLIPTSVVYAGGLLATVGVIAIIYYVSKRRRSRLKPSIQKPETVTENFQYGIAERKMNVEVRKK